MKRGSLNRGFHTSDLIFLQCEILALALRLLLHSLLKLLLGQLHCPHLFIQLIHVCLALLVHLLGILQGFPCCLELLDFVCGVLFGFDVLRPLLVQLRVLLPVVTSNL